MLTLGLFEQLWKMILQYFLQALYTVISIIILPRVYWKEIWIYVLWRCQECSFFNKTCIIMKARTRQMLWCQSRQIMGTTVEHRRISFAYTTSTGKTLVLGMRPLSAFPLACLAESMAKLLMVLQPECYHDPPDGAGHLMTMLMCRQWVKLLISTFIFADDHAHHFSLPWTHF